MRSTCTGRHWAVLPCLGTLAACGDTAAGAGSYGFYGFAALALAGAAALAYALGMQRSRNALESALREANGRARERAALADDWAWQTDAAHTLLSWQGPGRAPATRCPLFDDAALRARLQAQQPFAAQRLVLATPLDGWRLWELRATPRVDALGRFAGFSGAARPLDERESAQAAAAGLAAALQAAPGVALVLEDAGEGWRVHRFNAAAATRWPVLEAGQDLAALAGGWPEGVRAALAAPVPAEAEIEGWRLLPFGPLPGGGRGLVLAQAGAAPAAAAEGAPQAESDSFSFTVSHDLRAPIRVVEGFTRIVKEDYGRLLDRVGNDHLDRVLGAAARMNLMIDALLTLARLSSQPLARQPVNLSQLASYVVDDLRRGAPEREAEVEIQPGLQTQGDPTLLRLVLENLLGNAWKYSARCTKTQISLATVMHAGRTAYVVRDNGAGFDMRSAERLFGLFQRLHSASEFPGHGVGLASVRRIVQRHGGQIWAEAEPGKGAAFFFTLAG